MKPTHLLGLTVVALLALLQTATAEDRGAPAADAWNGTWNVTMKPLHWTCAAPKPSVYQWLVTEDASKIDVQVLGDTSFPRFSGKVVGQDVTLAAINGERPQGTTSLKLRATSPGSMVGERIVGYGFNSQACVALFSVTAKKQ